MHPAIKEQLRKGKRLSPEYLKSRISAVEFETKEHFGQKAIFCHIQLDNGFILYGQKPSVAIDPANFDEDLGRKLAYDDTFNQLWQLLAFSKLEEAFHNEQHQELIDVRNFIDAVQTHSFIDNETMKNRLATRFQFKETGFQFDHSYYEGEDIQEYLVEQIRQHLGVAAIKPERVMFIAKACHEANRAYCQSIGDDSQPAWADAPEWQKESAIRGVEFHLSGDHGPEASHQSWYDQKEAEGWVYGPVKDAEKKEHPCMVAYSQLPVEQRSKDYIFRSIVHSFK